MKTKEIFLLSIPIQTTNVKNTKIVKFIKFQNEKLSNREKKNYRFAKLFTEIKPLVTVHLSCFTLLNHINIFTNYQEHDFYL